MGFPAAHLSEKSPKLWCDFDVGEGSFHENVDSFEIQSKPNSGKKATTYGDRAVPGLVFGRTFREKLARIAFSNQNCLSI
jgi:hypothetical protein